MRSTRIILLSLQYLEATSETYRDKAENDKSEKNIGGWNLQNLLRRSWSADSTNMKKPTRRAAFGLDVQSNQCATSFLFG